MLPIHLLLFRRLFAVWLLVSALVGGAVYHLEMRQIDESIVALVASRVGEFTESTDLVPVAPDTGGRRAADPAALAAKAEAFARQRFVTIAVVDRAGQTLVQFANPRYADLAERFKPYRQDFPRDGLSHHRKSAVGDDNVVQVRVPLPGKDGAPVGYFDGVFAIDQATIAEFERRIWRTLAAVLVATLATSLLLYPVIIALNGDMLHFSRRVLKGNLEMAAVIGEAIAKRDSETGEHNFRVTLYAIGLGETVGLPPATMRKLILGAFLHDVGKIGIRDSVLLKPGSLTTDEFAVMRTHVALGVEIIEGSEWLREAREVVECHHEKYDGSGYPRGLAGEEIPLVARIFAIVDVFDALTSHRAYKTEVPLEMALSNIRQGAGSHFDPRLVAVFEGIASRIHAAIGPLEGPVLVQRLREKAIEYFIADSLGSRTA
ncbi:MAG TPA: HD domain-containing protein [Accumulibacter sp.]|jgi:HD-GYP domain-containing protein (c-di-GMP phosphodiesterase class II)|nr:HD domain-containing protein [Accumulibacter sp.]